MQVLNKHCTSSRNYISGEGTNQFLSLFLHYCMPVQLQCYDYCTDRSWGNIKICLVNPANQNVCVREGRQWWMKWAGTGGVHSKKDDRQMLMDKRKKRKEHSLAQKASHIHVL